MVGALGPSGSRIPPVKTWNVAADHIGYSEPGGKLVEQEGDFRFEKCTEERMRELQELVKPYSVLRVLADATLPRFFIKELLEADVLPLEDEEALFARYKLPVGFEDEDFGEFVFRRESGYFEGSVQHGGEDISVLMDAEEGISVLRFTCDDINGLIEKASLFAAENLLDVCNEWQKEAAVGNKVPFVPLTQTDFVARISLWEISIENATDYILWFDDGGIFWGHSITVVGNSADGFMEASIQG